MSMDLSKTPRLAAKARLRFDQAENRHLLVFPEAALALNPTAAEVLKLVDGVRTIEAISAELASKFQGADKDQIAKEVLELLSRLAEKKLVELG
jgi:pyrroloquinoline quinone biosynthesis protein D